MASERCNIFVEILLAIILPPLGVCLRAGCCTTEFLICLLLTLLGYIPGIIYALYIIVGKNESNTDSEGNYSALPQ
ncbi:hypothetical protein BVRB_8g191300 [Beta vulgaris subsp. vulgaris]|uniref:UPF0057 membrane protein At4g30650 n=1 Tax=Beta vulgaris subsp. vulgaris TaxID=3555 RepID=UPI00065C33A6|nr:UPF0057 membrane protein At4g30650 [Beta vulgaris subsp. vulgaris]KMT03446.1 hypothetical protein BVRB_8g191300 [Beta vulgaris subsp. vulgaris]